jgi:hypothetical protein
MNGAPAGFRDEHVVMAAGIPERSVLLDADEELGWTLAVATPPQVLEAGRSQRQLEQGVVPEELVPPAMEGPRRVQRRAHLAVGRHRRAVMSDPNPVEVGGREPQPAVGFKHPVRLSKEVERLIEPQMLEEVLGVHRFRPSERQPFGDVGDDVDPGEALDVDVDPPVEPLRAAADVEAERVIRFTYA